MYQVIFTERALKQLKKIDKTSAKQIKSWVTKNLVNCQNPKLYGKALKGNLSGVWRYRVGDYRLFANIYKNIILIEIFIVGHRKNIYKKQK